MYGILYRAGFGVLTWLLLVLAFRARSFVGQNLKRKGLVCCWSPFLRLHPHPFLHLRVEFRIDWRFMVLLAKIRAEG